MSCHLRLHDGDLAPHWHVLLAARLRESLHLDTLSEQQTMRATSEMEHARLLTLLDVLALLNGDLAGGDFVHSDTDECHEANGWVVCLDEDDGASGKCSQVTLTNGDTAGVNLLHTRLTETFEEGLGEVCSVLNKSLDDLAADGGVPSVVREGGKESLVDGAAGELLGQRVVGEHIADGVWLTFDPELVAKLDVSGDLEDLGLASGGDDVVVVWGGERADLLLEFAREEIVP